MPSIEEVTLETRGFLGVKVSCTVSVIFFFFFNSHVSNLVIVVLFFSSVAEGRVMLLSNIFVEETGLKYLLIS